MKYFINFNDFSEYKNAFENKIDEFREETFKVFKSSQNVEWVGLGHDKTIDALYNQIDELEKVASSLDKFVEIMATAMNDYSEGTKIVDDKFKEMRDIINTERIKRGDAKYES